jgi:hypothetical protein
MSAGTNQVNRMYPRYRRQLQNDAFAFTNALNAAGQAEATSATPDATPPEVVSALDQWRSDVEAAIAAINSTSRRASNRTLALQTMQALAAALASFADAIQLADPAQRVTASDQATSQLATWRSLADRLNRRIP